MLMRRFHSMLRRQPAWPLLKRLHANLAPRLCSAIGSMVDRSGTRVFSADAVLKHHFDTRPVHVSTQAITGQLKISSWQSLPGIENSIWARLRAWWAFSGGWKSVHRHPSRIVQGRFISGGDWDLRTEPLVDRSVITQLFEENRPPADTDEYRHLEERVRAGRFATTHGCRSLQDLDRYFDQMISIYSRIKEDGYLTQRELGGDPADEIRVCIIRDGSLAIYGGGTHRLSMARSLGLRELPVTVKLVHSEWADVTSDDDRRTKVAKTLRALAAQTSTAD